MRFAFLAPEIANRGNIRSYRLPDGLTYSFSDIDACSSLRKALLPTEVRKHQNAWKDDWPVELLSGLNIADDGPIPNHGFR